MEKQMKLKGSLLITLLVTLFCIVAFSVCAQASDIRYEYSTDNPNYHNIIVNGQIVGNQPHRAEIDATCMTLAVCHDCKAQFGDYAPHDFMAPTCTNPKTCTVCDYQEGEPSSHSGGQAECMAQAKCDYCGAEYGDPLGHTGGEATCTKKAECERCGETYGDTLPHEGGEATCISGAICTFCNNAYGELSDHVVSTEWTCEKEFHYNKCETEGCDGVFNDADHDDENGDGKCDVCDYKYKLSQTEKTVIIVSSVLGGLVLAGALTAVIIVIVKKKKEN